MPDHEPALGSADFPSDLEWTSGVEIAENADLLFHDGQYTDEEYKSKIGWGHSSVKHAIIFGEECKVKKMAIFHHDPLNSDERLEEIYQEGIRQTNPAYPVIICKEGEEFELG
jgi:ribonuclease BN (tRNA processing enzyme)